MPNYIKLLIWGAVILLILDLAVLIYAFTKL